MFRAVHPVAASLLALAAGAARADPGYYVVTVYDNPGLRTLDFRYWDVRPKGDDKTIWPEVGFGYNVNGRWYTELLASYIRYDGVTRLSTWNWQNDILLTQGQYPVDVALHTLYVHSHPSSNGSLFEFGPAVQGEIGATQLNGNVFFERQVGRNATLPTQLKYQWQVRHHWRPWLHFGAQGFGELGHWNHWASRDRQSHRAGPALFGTVHVGESAIGWQAAWLHGKTYGERGNMLTARIKYEF